MKPISYHDMKRLQKMSLNEFNRWIGSLYRTAVQDGVDIAEEDVVADVREDELMEILLSVKGIGQKRAEEVITKIMEADNGKYQRHYQSIGKD